MSGILFCFFKSSHSDPEHECVEVALNVPGTVALRDSKAESGPVVVFPPGAWTGFVRELAR